MPILADRIERDASGMPTTIYPPTRRNEPTATITPESEIYANADKSRFVMVDFREKGEVYLRQFLRGETVYVFDFSRCARMSDADFEKALAAEGAVRVGVEELDWMPIAKD